MSFFRFDQLLLTIKYKLTSFHFGVEESNDIGLTILFVSLGSDITFDYWFTSTSGKNYTPPYFKQIKYIKYQ